MSSGSGEEAEQRLAALLAHAQQHSLAQQHLAHQLAHQPQPQAQATAQLSPASYQQQHLLLAAARAQQAQAQAHQPQPQSLPPPQAQPSAMTTNQLLQLAAIQQQLQQASSTNPYLLNPAVAALYYSQLVSQFQGSTLGAAQASPPPPLAQASPSIGSPLHRPSPQLPPSQGSAHAPTPAAVQTSRASLQHPAIHRVASDSASPRRQSAPVIAAQPSLPTIPDAAEPGPSSGGSKPSLSSPKDIQNHIDELIRRNEAAVMPEAPLLRQRRTYQQRQVPEKAYQGLGSPPKPKQQAGRSVSLVESQLQVNQQLEQQRLNYLSKFHRGSLPAQLPSSQMQTNSLLIGGPQIPTTEMPSTAAAAASLHQSVLSQAQNAGLKCQHCGVCFPNELSLSAHTFRCASRAAPPQASSVPHPAQELALAPEAQAGHLPLSQTLSLDPNLLLRLRQQQQLQQLLLQQEAAALAAAGITGALPSGHVQGHRDLQAAQSSPIPGPAQLAHAAKSQHPLKKRILAEHGGGSSASAASPAPPAAKQPKLEMVEKGVGGAPTPVHRPVPTKPAAVPAQLPPPAQAQAAAAQPKLSPGALAANQPGTSALGLAVTLSAAEKAQSFQPYTRTLEVAVNPVEAKLNLLWMGGCLTRPRPGAHPFWKYTTAERELGVSRMTHSSFALYSQKLRAKAADKALPAAPKAQPSAPVATKEELWQRVLAENAAKHHHRRRLRSLTKEEPKEEPKEEAKDQAVKARRLTSVDDDDAFRPLHISASPQTSDTDDAQETEDVASKRKVAASSALHVKTELPDDAVPERLVWWGVGTRTPPLVGSAAAAEARLLRDCQSVPPVQLSPHPAARPSPSPAGSAASSLLASPTAAAQPGPSLTNLSPYLAAPSSMECHICDKRFSKTDLLRLHMNTHYYQESASSRRKAAKAAGPAKAAVEGGGQEAAAAAEDKDRGADDPRPYKCLDCDSAFRAQGFLQKHLRSKLHVMKLECMGKLPFGTFALFEAAQFNLAEIDTTDVQSALHSMQRHAIRLAPRFPDICDKPNQDQIPPEPGAAPPPAPAPASVSPAKVEPVSQAPSPVVAVPPAKIPLHCTEASLPLTPPPAVQKEEGKEDGSPSGSSKSVAAEVWVPPKESDIPRSAPPPAPAPAKPPQPSFAPPPTTAGPKNGEGTEERASTPQPAGKGSAESGSRRRSPGPALHVCHFCKLEAVSGTDLEVHLHADHIAMKDGHDFRCPRPNCDKIFPSRESLRHHIAAHYLGGGSAGLVSSSLSSGDGDVSRETMAALQRKLGAGGAPGPQTVPPAGTVGNQSPGTPEESQTSFAAVTGGRKKMKTHLVALNSIPEGVGAAVGAGGGPVVGSPLSERGSEASTPSPVPKGSSKRRSTEEALSGRRCASALDAGQALAVGGPELGGGAAFSLPALPAQLTRHAPISWFGEALLRSSAPASTALPLGPSVAVATSMAGGCPICGAVVGDLGGHLLSHVSSRPHVCPHCDAGFTTRDQLAAHQATHQS